MNSALLTAQIQYFLLNGEGLSQAQIAEMRSNANFASEIVPLVTSIASQLKALGQNIDSIEQNKNLLIGIVANSMETKA
jgi:hypothetical protein